MSRFSDLPDDERTFMEAIDQLNGDGLMMLAEWCDANGLEGMARPVRALAFERWREEAPHVAMDRLDDFIIASQSKGATCPPA